MASELRWQAEAYRLQSSSLWPDSGNHILAQFTEEAVVVYQAYRREIAEYAVEHQKFEGCQHFNLKRMTWIKTNFLWMMFGCGWASKDHQDHVLALWLKRSAFDSYLGQALKVGSARGPQGTVRLQWDPDHNPDGSRHERRTAVQLGLRDVPTFASGKDILRIDDVTPFVLQQRPLAMADRRAVPPHGGSDGYDGLMVARERVYIPAAGVAGLPNLHLSAPPREGTSDPEDQEVRAANPGSNT